jgi:hypothetical protein
MGFVYLQTWAKSNYKKKIDYESGEKYIDYDHPVRKKLLRQPDRIDIILSEGLRSFINSYFKILMAFRDMIPSIFEKHHDLFQTEELEKIDINSVTKGINVLFKFLTPFSSRSMDESRSFFDNRSMYGLDLLEWLNIAQYAEGHSYRETARKWGLSTNRMKKQLKEINTTAEENAIHFYNLMRFILKMKELRILSLDVELGSQFATRCKSIIEKFINEQFDVVRRATLEERSYSRSNNVQQEHEQEHKYEYYQIIHDKKAKRCGPFKESELPIELLIQYREKHKNQRINNANDKNYRDNWTKIQSHISDIPERQNILLMLCAYFIS